MSGKVIVYSTPACPFCLRARMLLENRGIPFEGIDLSRDPEKRAALTEQTGWMTVPMIFIGDEFIGGFNELAVLDQSGELEEKVQS